MSRPLMRCGHTAQGRVEGEGSPCCVICYPDPLSLEMVPGNELPNLEGRRAKCSYNKGSGKHSMNKQAHSEGVPSDTSLAFFEHRPDEPFDKFYCGCWGWD